MAGPNKFLEDLTSIHGAMLELSRVSLATSARLAHFMQHCPTC